MTTNADFIGDALRLLGVISETEAPTAEQGETSLRALNDLMQEWKELGLEIEFGYAELLSDDCEVQPALRLPVLYNLALRLHGNYPAVTLNPTIPMMAERGYARLVRDSVNAALTEASMSQLPAGEAFRWH